MSYKKLFKNLLVYNSLYFIISEICVNTIANVSNVYFSRNFAKCAFFEHFTKYLMADSNLWKISRQFSLPLSFSSNLHFQHFFRKCFSHTRGGCESYVFVRFQFYVLNKSFCCWLMCEVSAAWRPILLALIKCFINSYCWAWVLSSILHFMLYFYWCWWL